MRIYVRMYVCPSTYFCFYVLPRFACNILRIFIIVLKTGFIFNPHTLKRSYRVRTQTVRGWYWYACLWSYWFYLLSLCNNLGVRLIFQRSIFLEREGEGFCQNQTRRVFLEVSGRGSSENIIMFDLFCTTLVTPRLSRERTTFINIVASSGWYLLLN